MEPEGPLQFPHKVVIDPISPINPLHNLKYCFVSLEYFSVAPYLWINFPLSVYILMRFGNFFNNISGICRPILLIMWLKNYCLTSETIDNVNTSIYHISRAAL
jgi:hypothetical protein